MKLYSYSSELLAFVEAKWFIIKFAIWGAFIGNAILFGVIKLNQSFGNILGSQSTNTLTSDNNFLRQQVSLISNQVSKLEVQTMQLNERANTLHMLLPRRKIAGDSISSFTNVDKGGKFQTLISAAQSFRN